MRFTRKAARLAALRRRAQTGATLALALAAAANARPANAQIDATNWGTVNAATFGTVEPNVNYPGAELFTGPNQYFDSASGTFKFKFADNNYYHGVLPNGRIVNPAGVSIQIGMNPLGTALTSDGKFLITSNDDERDIGFTSLQSAINKGGYSLSVVDTTQNPPRVVSQIAAQVYIGLQVKTNAGGGYTLYASGGPSPANGQPGVVRVFNIAANGAITTGTPATIAIAPILPNNQGYVTNYTPAANTNAASGASKPSGYSTSGAAITFPAGSALSPASVDGGRYLYVACNGDNSLAVIDTTTNAVIKRIPVGYFPYGVSVSADGTKVTVSNWGIMEYKFAAPAYDANGNLTNVPSTGNNLPTGFFVPPASTGVGNPKSSSISIISVPGANPANASLLGSVYQGQPNGLDALYNVGDTHPSATAVVRRGAQQVLYVCKANSDAIGLISLTNNRAYADFNLSPVSVTLNDGHAVHGAYPNAIVAAPNGLRAYVAEAGINSVAVLDTTVPSAPRLLGRIPTGWYPTALSLASDASGNPTTLYVANDKGVGEDINPATNGNAIATGVESYTDGNFIFGSLQKIDLTTLALNNTTVLANNFKINQGVVDASIVPIGGAASAKIKHVIFILQENKTFDSMLGSQNAHFGNYASLTYNNTGNTTIPNGNAGTNAQFTPVSLNTQLLATTFATGVNCYSDSEESDAGHQYAASGTATDYTEKTLLNKSGRGLLVNKNFEPEDYPEGGYLYNNAARNGVSFKLYGLEAARIVGTDTGGSTPSTIDDPLSGKAGYPQLSNGNSGAAQKPNVNVPNSDVTSPTQGVGHAFFMNMPGLAVVGGNNASGVPRLDRNYPGYNFNISDQRRAREFFKDFDAMIANNTLPQFLYVYLPADHTGTPFTATNVPAPTAAQQVADGDVALGMVVNHIMQSPIYYNSADGTGTAIIHSFDDAQATLDHIHQHRTPITIISPYARVTTPGTIGNGYIGKQHYVTASIVKTEELLLGLPPNNLGDLFATDLRDLFQPTYNGITSSLFTGGNAFTASIKYAPSPEGRKVWALAKKLDTSAPDRDSHRLGALARLSMKADDLHKSAVKSHTLTLKNYKLAQDSLYKRALAVVSAPNPRDSDD